MCWRSWDVQRRKVSPHVSAHFFPNQCLPPNRRGKRQDVGWLSGLLRTQGGCIAQVSPAGGQTRGSTGESPGKEGGLLAQPRTSF